MQIQENQEIERIGPYQPRTNDQSYIQNQAPSYEQPRQPVYEQPAYQQPTYQQQTGIRAYDTPPQQPPQYQNPQPQQPVYEQPAYQEPVYQQPSGIRTYDAAQQPQFQNPQPQQPVYQQPQEPVYQQPVEEPKKSRSKFFKKSEKTERPKPANEQPVMHNTYGYSRSNPVVLEGAPNNQKNLRFIGMGLSGAAFVMIIVAAVAIPFSGNGMDYGSLISIGSAKNGTAILIFAIVAIIFGVLGILVPMISMVSSISLFGTLALLMINSSSYPGIGTTQVLVFTVVVVAGMLIALLATAFMSKYARSNVRNMTIFQCSMYAWIGEKGLTILAKKPKNKGI